MVTIGMTETLAKANMIILSQYKSVSNQHIVRLKHTQYYMSIHLSKSRKRITYCFSNLWKYKIE